MKLHLPKPLRNSVLACIAAVAGIATPTLGTATFAGGVVAFTLASQQAAAAEYTNKTDVTFANGDVLNLSNGAKVEAPLVLDDVTSSITMNVTAGTVTWATDQGENNGVSVINVASGATLDVTSNSDDTNTYCTFASKQDATVTINLAENATMKSNNLFGWWNYARGAGKRTVNMAAGSSWTINEGISFYLNDSTINMSGGTIVLAGTGTVVSFERRTNVFNTTTTATQMSVITGEGKIHAGNNGDENGGYQFNVERGAFDISSTNTADLRIDVAFENGGHGVQKTGSGVMEITHDSGAFTGSFFVRAGELKLTEGGNLGSTNLSVESGAVLTLNTTAALAAAVNVQNGGTLFVEGANSVIAGAVTVAEGGVFNVQAGAALTLNGTIKLGANTSIQNNSTNALALGSGMKFNLGSLVAADGENGAKVYTVITGEGNKDLSSLGLTSANITGLQVTGKAWSFGNDGTISYVVTTEELTWEGGDLTWNSADTNFSDGTEFEDNDIVRFTGTADVTIEDEDGVLVDKMTVTGAGTVVTLVENKPVTTLSGVFIENGATLALSGQSNAVGVLRGGEVTVESGGRLQFNAKDVTGYNGGATSTQVINVNAGGTLYLNHAENETFAGTLNLDGTLSGNNGAEWDMFRDGNTGDAADNAANANIVVSRGNQAVIDNNVTLCLRKNNHKLFVDSGASLTTGAIKHKENQGNGVLVKAGAGKLIADGKVNVKNLHILQGDVVFNAGVDVTNTTINDANQSYFGRNVSLTFAGEGTSTISGQLKSTGAGGSLSVEKGHTLNVGHLRLAWNKSMNVDGILNVTADGGMVVAIAATTQLVGSGAVTTKKFELSNQTILTLNVGSFDIGEGGMFIQGASRLHMGTTITSAGAVTLNNTELNVLSSGMKATGSYSDAATGNGFLTGKLTVIETTGDAAISKGDGFVLKVDGVATTDYEITADNDLVINVAGSGIYYVNNGVVAASDTIGTTAGFAGYYVAEGTTLNIVAGDTLSAANAAAAVASVGGAGTVVFNTAEDAKSVISGSSFSAFSGTLDLVSGQLMFGAADGFNANSGAAVACIADKVIVREKGKLYVHLGDTGRTFAPDIDLMSGSELANKDGNNVFLGDVCFNIADPAAETPTYKADGEITLSQYWGKTLKFNGVMSGAGVVKMKGSQVESVARYQLTNNDNTFAGTYTLLDGGDIANKTDEAVHLILDAPNAAASATVNLNTELALSTVTLNTSATVKSINTTSAKNKVVANAAATLTVSEGSFAGVLENGSDTNILSLVKSGTGVLTLSGANTYTGKTSISGGTLVAGSTSALGAGEVSVGNGGTLQLGAALALGGNLSLNNGAGLNLGGQVLTLNGELSLGSGINLTTTELSEETTLISGITSCSAITGETAASSIFATITTGAGALDLDNYAVKMVGHSLVLIDKGVLNLIWDDADDKNGGIWKADGAFTADEIPFVSNGKANVHFGAGAESSDTVNVEGSLAVDNIVIEGDYTFLSKDGGKIDSATKLEVQIGSVTLGAGVLDTDVPVSLVDGTTLKWGEGNTQDYSGKLTVGGNVTLDVNGNDVTLASAITGTAADKTISFASTGATAEAQNTVSINGKAVLGSAAVNVGENVILKLIDTADVSYANAITGAGSLCLGNTGTGANGTELKSTSNSYSGETIIAGTAKIWHNTLSANTSGIRFTEEALGKTLQFISENDGYVFSTTLSGVTPGDGQNQSIIRFWGNNMEFASNSADWMGTLAVNLTADQTLDYTGAVGGDIILTRGNMKVHGALANAVSGGGKLIIDGGTAESPIVWNDTNKTYTGQTQLAAGAYVTTARSLTTGANSKIVLGDNSQLTITGGLDSWTTGHTVSGTGTLVLSTGATHTNEVNKLLANGTTLSNLVLRGNATALEFGTSNQAAHFNAASTVTIEDGASLIMNADFSSATNTVILNGDGTGVDGSAALCFSTHPWTDGNEHTTQLRSNVVLGSDSEVYVGTHTNSANSQSVVDKGVILGTITGNGNTLIKTGDGTLQIDSIPVTAKIVVEAGTLDANAAGTWAENITMKNGASMLLSGETITLSDVTVDAAATTTIITGQANDADSTATLAKVSGSGVIELTRDNDGSRTGDYRVGLTGENADFTGTWKVTGRNVVLQAKHADALAGDTVELSYAGTQTAVSEMSELRLTTTGTTVNLGKLTGTAGIVTGSGKTLNIANSEITGVQYSGAIGEGVTIQVSDGYQKITGTDRTGNVTLATLRSADGASEEPGYDDLGGGALLLSEGEESAPVPNPVLDLAGYTHSTAEDAGVTTILAGNKGSIRNLVLGKNMLLTTQVADAVVSNASPANIGADLTLSGGKVKFHLNGSTAAEGEAFNAEVMTQYDLAGNNLVLGEGTVTALTFVPEAESGKLSPRTYQLFTNVGNLEDLVDDWKETSDNTICTSAKLAKFFKTNFSENGRTSYKFAKEEWPTGTHLSLLVEGGAADLVWNEASGTWDTGTPDAEGTESWMNGSTADYFMDDDNVVFNAQKGTDAHTITIDDEDGVRIGSMKVTGGADYLFTGGAITSGEGLGNVHIGTADAAYTGTVTFEKANSWKGNTNINSGTVVAKNAAALSNTTVNLNGGSLTVDGVALDATVKMLGGVLNTTAAEGGAVTVKADLSAAGKNMSVNAATGTNLNLTLVGTEDVAGIIGGNVIINGEVDKGKPVTSGAVNMTDATVVAGGSLNVATGDVTAGALVLQGAKEVAEGDTKIDAGAVTVKGGSLSAASLANAGSVTVDGASMSITGAVENSGSVMVDDASMSITGAVANTGRLTVTNGSLTMGALDNDGTLTIGGTEMKDVPLGEATVSMPESSVVVNGNLDNTNGTIIIGSAAVEDDPSTKRDETAAATYGSLEVTGDLTGTGAKDKLVVEAGSYLNVEGNLSAMENVELGIGGTVTVGGNVDISSLFVAKDALLHATGADSGTSSVEIGVLGGAGTVQVDNGTLHIGALKGFTGTLAGNGTLSTDNAQFLLETKQDTTTNITGGSVLVTEAANGSSVGLVTTNEIIINTMTTDAPSLSMTGVALKDVDTVNKLSITLTQMGTTAGVDGIIKAVDAADGGIDYHLLSIDGTQSLDLFKLAEDEAVHQYLLQKGYAHSDLLSAATFAAASSTDVYISFWKQSSEESTWNVGETETEAGLIVLKDGKLLSNDVLDNVQNVVVSGTKSIDLTAAGVNDVVLNKLVGTSTSKLTIAGDGKAGDSVSIGKSSYNGTLVLDGVAADFDLTGATVVGADKDTTLSGKLTNGTLSVQQSSTAQGAGLELKDSKVQVVIGKDFTKLTKNELDQMGGVIAKLGDVTTTGSSEVAVGTTSKGIFTDSVGYDKYFDMSSARVEGGKVVADRNTVYYTSKLTDSASTDNGKAGLAMADEVLLSANPQGDTVTGDLAAVLDQLDAMVATGNTAAADELGASLAGASTAVLGMAAMGDVDRQLRAIRNRTTTMGVDQSVVNADMPYFNAWINAEGDSREMGEDGTLGGYKLNSYGGTVGFDVDIEPTLTAGMALTAMYGDLDATGTDQATGNLDSYYVSAFARYCGSAWTHTFVGTIGMGDISLDRTVNGTQVKGETDSMSFGLMYEVGRVYSMDEDGTTCLQPVFNVTWKHTTVDAYTEKGGDVALSVDEQSLNTITFGLGARLQTVVGESMYNRTSIFECRLLAKADAGDTEGTSKVALGSSATHEVKSNEMGAIGIEVGAGLTIPLGDEGSSIFMDASAEIRADYTDVNGTVGYRVNF